MIQIVKYNKPRSGSGAVSASGAGIALSSLAGLLTQQQLATILEGYLLKETFDDLFVKESDGHGGYRIKAKYALYSNQYLSCLGNNPDAGTVELGATTLGGLNNVVASADEATAAAKVLVREAGASEWGLRNLSDIVGLDTTALATYLTNNHYAKTSDIPSLAGYLQRSVADTLYQPIGDYATSADLSSAVTSLTAMVSGKLDASVFDDLFVKEADGKGGYRIKARYALYSNQYLSCLGNNPDAGTVELGATTLGGLNNVAAAADEVSAAAKVLVREAGAASWTLKSLSDIVGLDTAALATYLSSNGYAKQSWVEAKGYLTQQSLAGYALESWVRAQGYLTGITKAQVEAVLTGNITSHTHSQYLTSVLAAQTYQPIGDYATNTALNSAVSSLNTAIGKKLDAATFDDLFVKESDGHGGYRIKAKYALYSNQYLSCLGNNPDAGTTTPSTPGVDLDAVAEYLTQQGYATQAWVQAQGYVTSLANYYTKAEVDAKVKYLPTYYVSRPTSANVNFGNAAGLYTFLATASMTTGKPAVDSHILHMEWDNGLSWAGQIAVPNSPIGMRWRYQGANSVWQPWRTILDTENYAATLNSKYVTLDTEQEIAGSKRFTAYQTEFGSRVTATGLFDSFANYPHFMWHVSNVRWSKAVMNTDGALHFIDGGATSFTSYRKLVAAQFAVAGGTSSQFLKADGSVDGNSYLTAHQSLDYIRVLDTRNAETTTSMAQQLTAHLKGNDKIGLADGGLYTGLLHLQPRTDASGGSAHDIAFTVNGNMWLRTGAIGSAWGAWRKVLDTNNYASVLDGRYVNASGDTMTGVLHVPTLHVHGSASSNAFITADTASNIYVNAGGNSLMAWMGADKAVRSSIALAGQVSLGTSACRWANVYANTINVSSASLVANLNADLLDGYHEGNFMRSWWTANPGYNCDTYSTRPLISFTYGNNAPFTGAFIDIVTNGYGFYLGTSYNSNGPLFYRRHGVATDGDMGAWQQLARIGDNVASATKLQTARSLWGNSFNGTGDISGNINFTAQHSKIGLNISDQANDCPWYGLRLTSMEGWHVMLSGYYGTSLRSAGGMLSLAQSGNVGIGTTAPECKLHVVGVIKSSTGMYSDGYMSCLGQNTGSDIRLKHIMGDVTLSLDMIADAPAKLFTWRYGEFAGRLAVGSIAQYWQQWLAPVVSKRPDDYLQMDYGVTALTATINLARIVRDGLSEHERRILALERENKELKSEINELKRRLAA